MEHMNPQEIQKVFAAIDIPPCPMIVIKTLEESVKLEPDLHKIVTLVMGDPGMSSSLMKLANSALYSCYGTVPNVRKASERLGTSLTISTILDVALKETGNGLPVEWLDHFWEKNRKIAIIATMIAKQTKKCQPDTTYMYALFRDASIPLLLKKFPNYLEKFDEAQKNGKSRIQMEEDEFPCSHPLIGGLLIKEWGLPASLGIALRFHHDVKMYNWKSASLPDTIKNMLAITDIAEHLLNKFNPLFETEITEDDIVKIQEILEFDEETLAILEEKTQEMIEH